MTVPNEPYPARIEAALDPGLSRWLWLVKWLLIIPHAIVLAFLWLAFWVLTLVAFFAILFTCRYPRPLYDFILGMDRWAVRVAAYAALMTDRYPPFRLDNGGTEPSTPTPVPPDRPAPVPTGPPAA